jgi:sugar phosphate isomerase/epimerase
MSHVSRRQFLALSAAAAGMSMFDLAKARAADEPYGGMPMGIQSYTLRNFDTAEAIRHVQGLGLHYVELFSKHLNPAASPEEVDRSIGDWKKAKITPICFGVHGFTKDHEANRKFFEFAKRAGFRNISADPQPDSFDSLDKLVAEFKIRIAIHNHGPGSRYDKLPSVATAVKGRHPLIGACVDTGHVLRSDEDPVKWIVELGERVFGTHIKDVAQRQDRTHNVVIGKGHLDVVGVFKALRKVKFPADGALSLEYEDRPENPIDDVRQCLVVAQEAIAKASA